MSTSTIDFNGAETQDAALALIPANTLLKVRITIRPGGAGPEGWLTQSKTSEAMYLNTEAVVVEGPQARRRIYTRIGVKGRAANGAVANVVGIRRGAISGGMSLSAQAARSIG